MGLWLKQDDGTLVEVSGGTGADGIDGLDGNMWHVGSGAPDPTLGETGDYYLDGTDGWVYVKRNDSSWTNLYVNLTGPPGDSGDGDYLPLSGGTLTGDLTVDGGITARVGGSAEAPAYGFADMPGAGMFAHKSNQWLRFAVAGEPQMRIDVDKVAVWKDLQVDGNADLIINAPADAFGRTTRGTVFTDHGLVGGTQGSFGTAMTSNGYRNDSNEWTSLGLNGQAGATVIELRPGGKFYVRAASNHPTGSAQSPPIRFTITEAGPTFRAMPSQTRTVDDILERAETAEFPPEDDEGVTTMDDHDEVPLFEVVSALLAKVKELSARIEALEK
jgi:hypothetical protein